MGLGIGTAMFAIIEKSKLAGGHRVTLWSTTTNPSREASGEENPLLADLAVVTSMEVVLTQGMAVQGSISLDMTYDQGMAFLNSSLVWPNNFVEYWFGYPDIGQFTPHFFGVVCKPEVDIGPDGVKVTLPVRGAEHDAMCRQVSKTWMVGPPDQIIKAIGERYGKTVEFSMDAFIALSESQDFQIDQIQVSDWVFMLFVARRYGCEVISMPTPDGKPGIKVVARKEVGSAKAKRQFVMRGVPDPKNNVYPMLTFRTASQFTWMVAKIRGMTGKDFGADDKKPAQVEASDATSEMPVQGQGSLAGKPDPALTATGSAGEVTGVEFDTDTTGKEVPGSSRDGNYVGDMQASFDAATPEAGIVADITSLGLPDVFLDETVDLVVTHGGENSILDGTYVVQKVTHRIGGDGWETELNVFKKGWPKEMYNAKKAEGDVREQPFEGGEAGTEMPAGERV